jgi:predicted transcriptional regulator
MEVKIDILQAISEGAGRPTHIMYRSNLSWAVMRNFIKGLEEQNLVISTVVEGRKNFILTPKGIRVLNTYANVRKQLENPQLVAQVI